MNEPVSRASAPSRKTLLFLGVAFAGLLGAFLLGRAAPPPTPTAAPETPTAAPASTPSVSPQTTSPAGNGDEPRVIADLRGSGDLVAQVKLSPEREALVLCQRRQHGAQIKQRLSISYLDTSAEPATLLAYDELTQDVRCSGCNVEIIDIDGETIGVGGCETFVARGAFEVQRTTSIAFIVAEPPSGIVSALGIVIDCGVTKLVVDGDEVLLHGEPPQTPLEPRRSYPPIRFERRASRFVADDLPLLRHYCNAAGSSQLFGYVSRAEKWFANQGELTFTKVDSQVGEIGLRHQVLVALNAEQCNALYDIQDLRLRGASTTLADTTGLEPPDDTDDWYLTCRLR